jgi:hypothetical protein
MAMMRANIAWELHLIVMMFQAESWPMALIPVHFLPGVFSNRVYHSTGQVGQAPKA